MKESCQFALEMNELVWRGFKSSLEDLTPEEINWRPLQQANDINTILRHLRIEAQWHLGSLEHGEQMPHQISASVQEGIDSVPLDFERNLKELEELYTRFLAVLRNGTLDAVQQQTALAYRDYPGEAPRPAHLLGFHQAVHLAAHGGQICMIRNLYRKTRGEPARFFPDNPTYPRTG